MNFLEELTAEWYGYLGYFVRTNIKTNKRAKGGYDNEIDVLAFSAINKELIHIESSWDAKSWKERKERFLTKKFVYAKEEYEEIIGDMLDSVRKIALVGLGRSTSEELDWGEGVEVLFIIDFIEQINNNLVIKDPLKEIVPEGYPRLRAMQFCLWSLQSGR